ncbi:hypothetical protein GIB67_017200 [Kingdonia uniflora]|uniref:Uncharacterized protein n=1 Tax=Kingdonia uniflora TaxID=39325 RepID=A0A7J7NKH8_9MAGN|nr:hypothetical protein GIB67_017200 [Kingdonia uniflora]
MLHTLHARKLSVDNIGSYISSINDSEVSNTGVIANLLGDETFYFGGTETLTNRDFEFPGDIQIALPLDQCHKLNRVLMTMQGRLATAKTDMEDLIARLNQEIAVQEYLTTKAKDLEIELEIIKQKKEDTFTVDSLLSDALDFLTTSDNRIGLLLAEAQLLTQDEETSFGNDINGDDLGATDNIIRKMLKNLFIDKARLRKQVNSMIRCALKTTITSKNSEEETPSRKTVLNKFLER